MNRRIARWTFSSLLSIFLAFASGTITQQQDKPLFSSAEAETSLASQQPPSALKKQAELWLEELKRQPELSGWKGAELHISPLGPGTHSWLALVASNNDTVGYMIIHATEDGSYQLGEYGIGEYSVFDNEVLQRSIAMLEINEPVENIERLYIHPLLAMWKMSDHSQAYYTDAASGEQLPVDSGIWNDVYEGEKLLAAGLKNGGAKAVIDKSISLPSFDPYERLPWLTKKPMQADRDEKILSAINAKKPLRYTAERFNGNMLYVWSVVGYTSWDNGSSADELYIALARSEYDGSIRYLPFELLAKLGHFYD